MTGSRIGGKKNDQFHFMRKVQNLCPNIFATLLHVASQPSKFDGTYKNLALLY